MTDMPKPCPFCGCKAITIYDDTPTILTVKCTHCRVSISRRITKNNTLEEAYIDLLARWNRRTQGEEESHANSK